MIVRLLNRRIVSTVQREPMAAIVSFANAFDVGTNEAALNVLWNRIRLELKRGSR